MNQTRMGFGSICILKKCFYSFPEKFYIMHVDSYRNVNRCFNCMFSIRCTFLFFHHKRSLGPC